MKTVIRKAAAADLDSIAAVEAECFPAAEAATREEFQERLDYYADHFLLAFDGDRLVAFIDGFVTDERDLTDEYRRQGLASKLITCFIADAREQGRQGLVLTCKDALVDYYSRFGFVNEGKSDKSTHGGSSWNQMRIVF